MGYLKYVRNLWKRPKENMPEEFHERLLKLRKEPVTVRLERPTRIDRARSLGYKAKQGIIVVRQRVAMGGHKRPRRDFGGRRPKRFRMRVDLDKNYRQIAEERSSKKYANCEVLNSYLLAKDGKFGWYEIILVDRSSPSIKADPQLSWICEKRGRAQRGLTSAGRKSRGLRYKGKGAEKLRPSRSAVIRKKNE